MDKSSSIATNGLKYLFRILSVSNTGATDTLIVIYFLFLISHQRLRTRAPSRSMDYLLSTPLNI